MYALRHSFFTPQNKTYIWVFAPTTQRKAANELEMKKIETLKVQGGKQVHFPLSREAALAGINVDVDFDAAFACSRIMARIGSRIVNGWIGEGKPSKISPYQ